MGQALTVASEQQAYTLSDKATYLAAKTDLSLLLETADDMLNTYSMIAISPARFADTNIAGAEAFIEWIKTDKAKAHSQNTVKRNLASNYSITLINR